MAKGPLLTQAVIDLIAKVRLEHTDWQAKQVQKEVQRLLKEEATKKGMNPPPDNWPGLSAIQDRLKEMKPRFEEMMERGLDTPWCMGTLEAAPISPEALPIVLKAWWYAAKELNSVLTIREAIWVARIYKFIELKKERLDDEESYIYEVCRYAEGYAGRELVCELTKRKKDKIFDTLETDLTFFAGVMGIEEIPPNLYNFGKDILNANNVDVVLAVQTIKKQAEKPEEAQHERPHRKKV